MIEVIVLACEKGSSYRRGCRCHSCALKHKRRNRKWREGQKAQSHERYVKSIMRTALDIANTFEELCPQHRPELLSLAKRFTGSVDAAEDLTQETLLKAYRHWGMFKQETADLNRDVRVWLNKILTNTFYTEWQRDQKRNQMYEEFASELDEAPETPESEENDRLRKVMDKLRPMYREVLDLHYMQDKSYQQIADTLGIKFVQVQKRLYRARQYVKMYYEQAGISLVRVNPSPGKAPKTVKPEPDGVDSVVRRDDTKPLRRRKPRPDTLSAR